MLGCRIVGEMYWAAQVWILTCSAQLGSKDESGTQLQTQPNGFLWSLWAEMKGHFCFIPVHILSLCSATFSDNIRLPHSICSRISMFSCRIIVEWERLLLSVSRSLYGVMFHRNCHSPPLPFSFLHNLFVLVWLALLSTPPSLFLTWFDCNCTCCNNVVLLTQHA